MFSLKGIFSFLKPSRKRLNQRRKTSINKKGIKKGRRTKRRNMRGG